MNQPKLNHWSTCAPLALALLAVAALGACGDKPERTADGRLIVRYWEKWTGFEGEAMKAVVDKYNDTQGKEKKIFVKYLTTSQMEHKLLLATAGGNPPEVAGFWSWMVPVYSELGALTPLDKLLARDGLNTDDYLPNMVNLMQHRGFTWGVPSTPATLALHYNKRLFREAGLDPERPPRTMEELWEYAEKLTKRDERGHITQLGFNPRDPNWWDAHWCIYFGADLLDADGNIACDSPGFIESFEWGRRYTEHYGVKEMDAMRESGAQFDSAQNQFIAENLAMQIQGVWMSNFINRYNPNMEWGAAPFPYPADRPELKNSTLYEADILVIPKGCKHVEEAWDFIKFTQREENIELLNLGQRKFSPLKKVSAGFYQNHPNPYIKVFSELAKSPNGKQVAHTAVYQDYKDELTPAFEDVWLGDQTAKEALAKVRRRIEPKLEKNRQRWEAVKEQRLKQWNEWEPPARSAP